MSKSSKIWCVTALFLIFTGLLIFAGVMTMLKWDFKKLSTVNYVTNTYDISESFDSILIDTRTSDVKVLKSKDESCSVVCHDQKSIKHSVTVENNTLTIKLTDSRKWYEHIQINSSTPKITVYLPKSQYDKLDVKSSTGNISVNNLSFSSLMLSVSTGDIMVSDVNCFDNIDILLSTGDAEISNLICKKLYSKANTGDIKLNEVIAENSLTLKRSTGDVKLNKIDANEISIKTDTGDVSGTILSKKVFITKTNTGNINVPKTTTGGKCEITTTTGDIKIEIK